MTEITKPSEVKRDWVVIDATDKRFGRMLTEVAVLLRGINASKAVFTGNNKGDDKLYHSYSGYFGSVKSVKFQDLLKNNPAKLYRLAVRGMLPKTKLGKAMIKKLFVYEGGDHPHTAQTTKKGK